MPAKARDVDIIEHILRYCVQIETAHEDFGRSAGRFSESTTYQNAVCMCILQIGELVGRLSNEFKAEYSEIPWHRIRGMRNYVAHEYGSIDLEVVWYTATNSIFDLTQFCKKLLDNPENT